MCVLSCFSHVWLFATLLTVACQAPLSRQEYWNGLPCPTPGNLPDPGIEPTSLKSPALAGRFFATSATWEALVFACIYTFDWVTELNWYFWLDQDSVKEWLDNRIGMYFFGWSLTELHLLYNTQYIFKLHTIWCYDTFIHLWKHYHIHTSKHIHQKCFLRILNCHSALLSLKLRQPLFFLSIG